MDFPTIKRRFAGLLRHIPGVMPASFVDSKNSSEDALTKRSASQDCPFVLVSHASSGQWDVYSGDFDNPLASFNERQEGCDFAAHLAESRINSIVLIRDTQAKL